MDTEGILLKNYDKFNYLINKINHFSVGNNVEMYLRLRTWLYVGVCHLDNNLLFSVKAI